MALDPSIILGAKSPQFDLSQFSPMNTLASAMKLKQLQQEGDINALNLRERRGLQEFLSGGRETEAPDLNSPEARTALVTRFGETGRKVATGLTGIDKARADLLKAETDEKTRRNALTVSKTAQYRDLLANVNDQRSAIRWIQLQQNDPDLVDSPIAKVSIMDAARSIPADPEGFNQWKQQAALGISKFIELNKPSTMQINRGGATDVIQTPGLGGAPKTVGSFVDVPLPADVQAQNLQRAAASRPVTTVQLPPQEKAEQIDRGKLLVDQYKDISKAAGLAAKTLPSLDTNLNILNKGFTTGFGTETKAAGASVLAALGVSNADKFATNAQIFQAKATEAVLQKQLEQKGPQTEADAKRIDAVGAQLGKTTDGNKFLLTVAKEQLRRDIDQRNFYDAWWKKNKTYDGAEDAWFAGEGGRSLFDRPALKSYAAPAESTAAQIPTTATPTRAAPAPAIPQAAIDALRAGRGTDAQFDAIFGPGAAKRARGGK
jgi:hypothetical protein